MVSSDFLCLVFSVSCINRSIKVFWGHFIYFSARGFSIISHLYKSIILSSNDNVPLFKFRIEIFCFKNDSIIFSLRLGRIKISIL